jgi:hypothetical protein
MRGRFGNGVVFWAGMKDAEALGVHPVKKDSRGGRSVVLIVARSHELRQSAKESGTRLCFCSQGLSWMKWGLGAGVLDEYFAERCRMHLELCR